MMNENSNQMQVYVVIGGFNYEGESFDSLQLFDCKSTAEMYSKDLEDGENNSGLNAIYQQYDYVEMRLQDVVMHSMIAS
jgi:hypothetical protein